MIRSSHDEHFVGYTDGEQHSSIKLSQIRMMAVNFPPHKWPEAVPLATFWPSVHAEDDGVVPFSPLLMMLEPIAKAASAGDYRTCIAAVSASHFLEKLAARGKDHRRAAAVALTTAEWKRLIGYTRRGSPMQHLRIIAWETLNCLVKAIPAPILHKKLRVLCASGLVDAFVDALRDAHLASAATALLTPLERKFLDSISIKNETCELVTRGVRMFESHLPMALLASVQWLVSRILDDASGSELQIQAHDTLASFVRRLRAEGCAELLVACASHADDRIKMRAFATITTLLRHSDSPPLYTSLNDAGAAECAFRTIAAGKYGGEQGAAWAEAEARYVAEAAGAGAGGSERDVDFEVGSAVVLHSLDDAEEGMFQNGVRGIIVQVCGEGEEADGRVLVCFSDLIVGALFKLHGLKSTGMNGKLVTVVSCFNPETSRVSVKIMDGDKSSKTVAVKVTNLRPADDGQTFAGQIHVKFVKPGNLRQVHSTSDVIPLRDLVMAEAACMLSYMLRSADRKLLVLKSRPNGSCYGNLLALGKRLVAATPKNNWPTSNFSRIIAIMGNVRMLWRMVPYFAFTYLILCCSSCSFRLFLF